MSALKHPKGLTPRSETAALSRAGRKEADAIMEAAKFKPNAAGSRFVRRFEVHGIEVTEWISAEKFAALREDQRIRRSCPNA